MDGYTLAAQLRRTRRRYRLSATSQALFYELVALANEERWPAIFSCSNGELMNALGVSENTMILARQELIRAGLIYYKSQKNKRLFSEYRFIVTSEFDAKADAYPDVKADVNPDDYNKLKEKPKPKQTEVVVACDAAFGFFKSTKNKRLLMEKHSMTEDELELYFLVFYDSKVDLGDLNGKTVEEIARNFYYWLPKHLAAQQVIEKRSFAPRQSPGAPPIRGVAAALQFTDVVMRE
jgi:hypothetical protein